jgi:hypothetical protein
VISTMSFFCLDSGRSVLKGEVFATTLSFLKSNYVLEFLFEFGSFTDILFLTLDYERLGVGSKLDSRDLLASSTTVSVVYRFLFNVLLKFLPAL